MSVVGECPANSKHYHEMRLGSLQTPYPDFVNQDGVPSPFICNYVYEPGIRMVIIKLLVRTCVRERARACVYVWLCVSTDQNPMKTFSKCRWHGLRVMHHGCILGLSGLRINNHLDDNVTRNRGPRDTPLQSHLV